jgi:hypothetical protein
MLELALPLTEASNHETLHPNDQNVGESAGGDLDA